MGTCHPSLAAPLPLCPFMSPETGALGHVCRYPAAQAPSPEPRGERPSRGSRGLQGTHVVWQGARAQDMRYPCPLWASVPSSVNEPVDT